MSARRVTILAGSRAFASALAGPLAERIGEAPRLASDPGQAFALARAGSAVLVLEYDPAWAKVLRDLVRSAGGLRIVAALPPAAVEAEPALRALGARTVRWNGEVGPVLDAVRPVGGPALTPAPGPALTPAPGPALTPAPGPALTPAPGPAHTPAPDRFFGDVATGSVPASSAPQGAVLWPGNAPSEEDAEHILCSALAGLTAAGDAALDATLEALTPLETEALQSLASVRDPAPIRRLSALRYRVAAALSSAPGPGSPVDAGGGTILLAEIDQALAALKAAAASLPERAGEVDAIRAALVKQAVDLSEALHRVQPGAAVAAPTAPARDPRRTTGRIRIDEIPRPAARWRGRKSAWVALAAVAIATAAFHGWNHFGRTAPPPPPAPFGVPAGMNGAEAPGSAGRLVVPRGAERPSEADLEAFQAKEEAAGRSVKKLAPGVFLSTPAGGAR